MSAEPVEEMETDLDALLADVQDFAPPTLAGEPTERKCYRHKWVLHQYGDGQYETYCRLCNKVKDEIRSRRGRSSRRLGHDGERRSEKRYGWRKTGEFGGIDDLVGKLMIVQQKTTRSPAPIKWKGIFARLDERAAGRVPAILLSFVRAGVDTEDFILVRGRDWLALHGLDQPE